MVVGICTIAVVLVLIAELWLDDLIAIPARRFIERELSAATGLEARIRGVVDLDFVPELRIEATQLALTRKDQPDPILSVDDVELKLDLWLLVSGTLAIDELQLSSARLNLRSAGGASAIDVKSLVAPPDDGANVEIDFRIERIELEDFRIEYNDSAGVATRVMVIDELLLAADAPEAAVSLSLTGSFGESPFSIQGEIGAATQLLHPTAPYPVSLQAHLPEANVEIQVVGHLAQPTQLRGVELDVRLNAEGLDLIQPFVGVPLPVLDSVEVEAHVSDRDGSLGVRGQLRASGADGGLSVELSGSDGDLRNFEEIDIGFDIQARDLALVGETLALEWLLPPVGPVVAQGRLRGHVGALPSGSASDSKNRRRPRRRCATTNAAVGATAIHSTATRRAPGSAAGTCATCSRALKIPR